MLVDAGGVAAFGAVASDDGNVGAFDIGRRVVAPALRAMGVRHLDSLTLTHGDPDHIGGAAALLGSFRPFEIREGVPVPPHPGLQRLLAESKVRALHWRETQADDVDRVDGVEVRVLHPPRPDWERQRVRNEDSIVLDVRFGDVSVVLPGDIGGEGERLVRRHIREAPIVVLKAPHHGSATSSSAEFLDALRPSAVVFSAGRGNMFGHPDRAVVARYAERGATMLSTADDGAVLLETDGKSAWIGGWTGERGGWLAPRRD